MAKINAATNKDIDLNILKQDRNNILTSLYKTVKDAVVIDGAPLLEKFSGQLA